MLAKFFIKVCVSYLFSYLLFYIFNDGVYTFGSLTIIALFILPWTIISPWLGVYRGPGAGWSSR